MVSAPASGSTGLCVSPGQGHCVVFLGKTLYSHSVFLRLPAGGNPAVDKHSIQGE